VTDPRASRPSLADSAERVTVPGRAPGALPPLALRAPPAASVREALAIGFSLGLTRILRRPAALSALLGGALVVVSGLIERRAGSAGAVDRALGATFNVVVPLVTFGVCAEASGRQNLREGVWPAARYGLARRDVALGAIGAAGVASAALSALFAALAVIVAHAAGNPPLIGDLVTSGWIAALTAAAYTGWFSLGATFGRRGGWRWVPLGLDFALGAVTGLAAAFLPRAHAASLLGGPGPLGMPQSSSSLVLAASAMALSGAAAARCRE
jgi:hypothetical protein